MAKECGWTKDYIADIFTLTQIRRYYEIIYKEKLQDLKLQTISMAYATSRAFGGMKKDDFKKYLDSLDLKPVDFEKNFKSMKKKFPGMVEEK